VVILDARRMPTDGDLTLLAYLARLSVPPIVVLTKADKLPRGRLLAQRDAIARVLSERVTPDADPPLPFSSVTGSGKDALWRLLRRHLGV
jgi:GTP-binding protein